MASRDVRLDLDPQQTIVPQSVGGAVVGTSVDLAGAEAALVVITTGAATTPATFKVRECDTSGGTYTDVADSDLIGVTGNTTGVATVASAVQKVSYIGSKRFIKVETTAGASAALFGAAVIRAHLRQAGGNPV